MTVTLIAATTEDGFIGRESNDRSFDWTSPEDSRFYINTIKKSDAIVMGSSTFKGVKLHPKNSHYAVYSRNPESFINPRPEVITAEATDLDPRELLEKLEKEGRQNVVIAGGASIYKMFIEADVVDILHIIIEPVSFGKGILLFKDVPFDEAAGMFKLAYEKPLNEQKTILQEWLRKDNK